MTQVTPITGQYTRTNQDCDEKQAVLCDLQNNRRSYLAHPDAMVRCYADWTLRYLDRRVVNSRGCWQTELGLLYRRLREIAV